MQEQQYDLAQRHLIELANFAGEFQDIVNYTTIIPMLEERLVQGIKDQQLLLTEQYIREKDYDAADEALRELLLASDLLTSGELAILREYVDRLNSEECADEVKQIVDQMSYLDLTIDDSIAQQTVNDYQHILDVSPKMNSTQKTRLLACAVAAASKLDDDTEARAAFEKYLRAAPQATLTRDLRRLNPALRNVRGQ